MCPIGRNVFLASVFVHYRGTVSYNGCSRPIIARTRTEAKSITWRACITVAFMLDEAQALLLKLCMTMICALNGIRKFLSCAISELKIAKEKLYNSAFRTPNSEKNYYGKGEFSWSCWRNTRILPCRMEECQCKKSEISSKWNLNERKNVRKRAL